ncbi:MAG: NAD(P)H-dependent glycerol-3-phosphate dehydrogenase [Rikenellaceae bacterium]
MEFKLNKNRTCAVIGYGSWATAIVKILSDNGNRVSWHITNADVVEGVEMESRNPKYLRDAELQVENITIYSDINDTVSSSDIVILATPSAFLVGVLSSLELSLSTKLVITAIKGIIPENNLTVVDYLNTFHSVPMEQICAVTGPCHAEEVSLKRLSYLTAVSPDIEVAHLVGEMFDCSYINISYSTDLNGIEYATILKNIYAISVGIAVGMGYGDNFVAVLIANCAREMNNFVHARYPDSRDTRESAYLGDLLVTCYSQYSRNRRFGTLLGRGFSVKSALNEMTMVAEGYYASRCVEHIKGELETPIADMVYSVLYKGVSARKAMKKLTKEFI